MFDESVSFGDRHFELVEEAIKVDRHMLCRLDGLNLTGVGKPPAAKIPPALGCCPQVEECPRRMRRGCVMRRMDIFAMRLGARCGAVIIVTIERRAIGHNSDAKVCWVLNGLGFRNLATTLHPKAILSKKAWQKLCIDPLASVARQQLYHRCKHGWLRPTQEVCPIGRGDHPKFTEHIGVVAYHVLNRAPAPIRR